jgi:glycosyltransferase involved in cell wall biosynthesis
VKANSPRTQTEKSQRPSLVWINQFAVLPNDGGGTRHFELGRELVRRGWDVTIVASDYHPHRRAYTRRADADNHGAIDETVDGVRFRWLWAASYKSNDWRRAINWLTFHRSIAAMRELPTKPDLVIGSSPQLFAATAARKLARRLRVPFVFEVRDLWPEGLLAVGGKKGVAYIVMGRVASGLYRDANRIMVLAAGVARYLTERGTDPNRIFHVPNGVDIDLVQPAPRTQRTAQHITSPTTLVYAGAHGPMNGLDAVLEAASILAALGTHVRFVLIGDGPRKNHLMAAASARGLKNIEFRDPLPKSELANVLASADAGMMLLRDAAMFSFAVSPNKLFDYLSAGIPVICNVPGETADLLASSRAGIQTRDTSAQALVDAVDRLRALSQADRERMGRDGRQWVAQNHSREVLGARLDEALREIVAK